MTGHEGLPLAWRGLASVFMLLLLVVAFLVGCGRPAVSSRSAEETTGEATASKVAPSESLQGVMDSYVLAHEEISAEGGEKDVGEYEIGYIVEPAEGWWQGDPGDLSWRDPAPAETNHIEILPFDAETGLLIPYMEITLTVLDESGERVDSKPLAFYYSDFYHYANNFELPGSGGYTLEADLTPPAFRRHGDEEGEGKVFTSPVRVRFEDVEVDTEE